MTVRPLYAGAIKANEVGAFVKGGLEFAIIHPGYDAQGRRRTNWTQVVYGDVPIWEWKVSVTPSVAVARFDAAWASNGCDDPDLAATALRQCVAARRARFRDGKTGEAPARVLARDGREIGKNYPA